MRFANGSHMRYPSLFYEYIIIKFMLSEFFWARNEYFISVQLVDDSNVCTLLSPGRHLILPVEGLDSGHCGLVPIKGKVDHITSRGLTWNLCDSSMELGVFISVCNIIEKASYISNSDVLLGGPADSNETVTLASLVTVINGRTTEAVANALENVAIHVHTSHPVLWTNSVSF